MPDHQPHAPPAASPPTAIRSTPARAGGDSSAAARLYHNARREAVIVLAVWVLALAWTVGYCYLYGYRHDAQSWVVRAGLVEVRSPESFGQIAGLPDWVVFGILAPWMACTAFTVFFCMFLMSDDNLGAEAEEGAGHGH